MSKKLLRKKLALMLANLKKKRKYYCEVEYLQSSGTQYIDTRYEMTAGKAMTFNGNIMWTQSNGTANFFYGYRSVNSATYQGDMRAFFVYGQSGGGSTGRLAIRYGVNTDNSTSTISQNQKYNISFDGTNLKVDGTTFINLSDAYTPAVYQNMYLFWCNCTGYYSADVAKFSGRVYNWQIFEDGVLVRDMIPVLDWNMTPCMYDRVTEQLFYNQGTGDFVAGREIHYVEYLERPVDAGSGSSMWINTGLKYFADFEVGVSLRESVSNTCLGTSTAERLERNSATYPQWKFTSAAEGAYASNISIIGYHELKWKDGKIYADGVQLTTKAKTSTASTYPMVLFGIPTSATTANAYHNIIHFCKLWNPTDGTLVRDYIPAIDENGVGYMFDRVSHTIYDNAGTGAFKYPAREVEYLQSSGTQYIDTGYIASNTSGFKVDIMPLQATDKYFIGSRPRLNSDDRFLAGSNAGPQVYVGWNTNTFVNWTLNNVHTVQNNFMNSRTKVLDGTTIAQITSDLSSQGTRTVYLFSANDANAVSMDTCRIYKVQISEGSSLVRDFVTVFKDGSSGMLDKVNNVFYTNAGTGTFNVGKIVESLYE